MLSPQTSFINVVYLNLGDYIFNSQKNLNTGDSNCFLHYYYLYCFMSDSEQIITVSAQLVKNRVKLPLTFIYNLQ